MYKAHLVLKQKGNKPLSSQYEQSQPNELESLVGINVHINSTLAKG